MSNRRTTLLALGSGATLLAGWSWLGSSAAAAEIATPLPPPAFDPSNTAARETAVFAGGCFWGVQAVFQHTRGVLNAVSGYSGGDQGSANYASVSAGRSTHAEAVEVSFDPRQVSYGKLLQVFFSVAHDPTQLDRQGPDAGPQYRSALFYRTPEEKAVIDASKSALEKKLGKKIATQVTAFEKFYPAEGYHQNYVKRNPKNSYVRNVSIPRLMEAGFKE